MLKKTLKEYGIAIAIAMATALILRAVIVEAYRVPTSVMRPSLLPGDFVFAAKWPYLGNEPSVRHGEIVIYRPAADSKQNYIGRVIGVEGDKIDVRAGVVHWNGKALTPEYQGEEKDGIRCGIEPHPKGSYPICIEKRFQETFETVEVPKGQVFVMTDFRGRIPERNRPSTSLLPLSHLRARPLFIWLSINPDPGDSSPKMRFDRVFKKVQ